MCNAVGRNEYRKDSRSYEHYWTSHWNKAWKKFRPLRDLNPWPLRYRCNARPTEQLFYLSNFPNRKFSRVAYRTSSYTEFQSVQQGLRCEDHSLPFASLAIEWTSSNLRCLCFFFVWLLFLFFLLLFLERNQPLTFVNLLPLAQKINSSGVISFQALFGLWKIADVNFFFSNAAVFLDHTLTKTLKSGTFNSRILFIFDSRGRTCLSTIPLNEQ